MPLYEYQCQQCNRRVEKIQKFSDSPLTTCPHCGGTLERTLTAPAVQFKGSGWYKDLYSSAKPASSTGADNGSGAGEKAPAGDKAAGGDTKGGAASSASSQGTSSSPASTPAAPSSPSTGSTS